MTIAELTNGRWPDLLAQLGGLTPEQLTNKHQPCPLCGGKDRYRFDDQDGSGSWFCNQCGGKDQSGGGGTGMDLLMRHQGWSYPETCRHIEQHFGIAKAMPEPPIGRGKQHWQYSSSFYVVRNDKPDGTKDILPLWFNGDKWLWKAPPSPRPLYGKQQLAVKPNAPVLIVEGEKTADAAALLYPSAVIITWPSGCKAIDKADWSPLAGRRCVLWPDADAVGREAMAKLAPRLLKAGADQVRIVHPPSDVPEGWDLADANWTLADAAAYLKANRSAPIELPELAPEPEPEPIIEPEPLPDGNDYFTCLGFDHDAFYYQPHSTGQVTRLSRSAHTGTNLCAIAPIAYWESLYPSKTGANWTAAASSLFERQASAGIYAPDRIRGRGAWWDQKQSVLHLGDRLVLADREVSISSGITGSRYLYQRLGNLRGPGKAEPLGDQDAYVLLELAGRFKWEVPASGLLIAGWAALAPICGALDWRPHIWLTAGAGSGKSAILDRYIGPLLGDLALHVAGNTSEAGLRQTLRADALPVVFDEAESNERPDQQRMQSVLSLARVASSESRAQTIKGSAEGDAQRYTIRSMFLMSSIATALKQGADKSRFAQLTLRNPNEFSKEIRIAHWEALDRDLDRFITEKIGQRLQARTISLIPVIRESAKVFIRAAAEAFDSQRLGDQYGTLLAGAWSLQSSKVPTRDEAFALIDQNDWESYSQTTEVPDEKRCLQCILQKQIKVEADKTVTRTVGELVERTLGYSTDMSVTQELAEATLGRNGIKAEDGCVVISNTAEAIAAMLSDTPWSNCWPTVLARLPGAKKPGVTRFKGMTGTSRSVSIPLSEA